MKGKKSGTEVSSIGKPLTYTTGKLARKAGVNLQTIRYYERSGLLPSPKRDDSGYRQYTEAAFQRLMFIRKAQTLGFSLKEIRKLLELKESDTGKCSDVEAMVRSKIALLEEKIADLKKVRSVLDEMSRHCEGTKTANECYFITEVEKRENIVELKSAI